MATDYGTDLSCGADLDPNMRTISGRPRLGQAIERYFRTPRGRLLKHPNYGNDLAGRINDDLSQADIASIASDVEAGCLTFEQVLKADVSCVFAASTLTVVITITDAAGPFALVLAVSAVSVTLVSGPGT
jgi:phage baseplate assembly protein W